jgi:signal recognition particle subunit SRP54
VISEEDGRLQAKKMQKGTFDFNDFLFQTQAMRKMGGLAGLMKQLPGSLSRGLKDEEIYQVEQKFKRYESIISTMTPEERSNPELVSAEVNLHFILF